MVVLISRALVLSLGTIGRSAVVAVRDQGTALW